MQYWLLAGVQVSKAESNLVDLPGTSAKMSHLGRELTSNPLSAAGFLSIYLSTFPLARSGISRKGGLSCIAAPRKSEDNVHS